MRLRVVLEDFSERHIGLTWVELHHRFGFDQKSWEKKFNDYLMKQPRGTDIVSAFFKFGNDRINPILNELLGRASGFPTFNRFLEFIVKNK